MRDGAVCREDIRRKAACLCSTLYAGRTARFVDRRDQRLIYRLALLRLDPRHGLWIKSLVETVAEARARRPFAYLQAIAQKHAPAGVDWARLMASIAVPLWALADFRDWDSRPP